MPWKFYTNQGIEKAGENLGYLFSTGPAGPTGPAYGTISVGTVVTATPGTPVSVTNSGTATDAVFNFTIPRGERGATGPAGPTSLSAGIITMVPSQSTPRIQNSGTSTEAIFDFYIPRGFGVNTGGTAGQVLTKASSVDYDTSWQTVSLFLGYATPVVSYATPIGQVFTGFATPLDKVFSGYATPIGRVFADYATPSVAATPIGVIFNHYATPSVAATPIGEIFQGYATPAGSISGYQLTDFSIPRTKLVVGFIYPTEMATPFYGFATPLPGTAGSGSFPGYATPVGEIFYGYATPTGMISGAQITNESIQSSKLATPFLGYATPVPGTAATTTTAGASAALALFLS